MATDAAARVPGADRSELRFRLLAQAGATPLGAIFAAIGVAGAMAVGWLHLDHLPFTVCSLKALTGIPCFSCGGTRALGRLFAFDLGGALAMNPLMTLGGLGIAIWGLADLALLPWGRAVRVQVPPMVARVLRIAIVVALVLNWVFLVVAGR
ncbi:MAG TPA: DUF2752 domain-containing protein [Vicinamibacteria bacterium]|nr:DUF2752 domain-containing protein [Vicinamibacteria bacterium]